MRVLHLYSGNLFGGVEQCLLTMARQRQSVSRLEPEFALCFEGRLSNELRLAGVAVDILGSMRWSRPWTVYRVRRRLREQLNHRRPDFVICHAGWTQAAFAPVIRSARIPLIFWQHDATGVRHWLDRWAWSTPPDLAICNSQYTAVALGRQSAPVEVLHCPVASGAISEDIDRGAIRRELVTAEDAIVIVQACRLEEWKGHRLLLSALSLIASVPNWTCWLIGGPQKAKEQEYLVELRRTVEKLNLYDRVRFLGQRSDVPRLLAAADVHCQPNMAGEPFGIAFVEAMLARLPVVTTALGAAPEIIDGTCGTLVPVEPAALANALRELIADEPLRRRMGEAGAVRARQLCDPEKQLARLASLLEAIPARKVVA